MRPVTYPGAVIALTTLSLATVFSFATSRPVFAQSRTVPTSGSGTTPDTDSNWAQWNLFKTLLNKSDSEINTKIASAYEDYVNGDGKTAGKNWSRSWDASTVSSQFPLLAANQGNSNRRVIYPYTKDGVDEAFAYNSDGSYPGTDSAPHGVLSEGQSYAMMIAVQMNDKTLFDRLWRFAKKHMQAHYTDGSDVVRTAGQPGEVAGGNAPYWYMFRWHCDINTSNSGGNLSTGDVTVVKGGETSASDGDQWFAAALLIASARWGDGSGIYNYKQEAQNILSCLLHLDDPNSRFNKGLTSGMYSLFTPDVTDPWDYSNQVQFTQYRPYDQSIGKVNTDPSYHVPAFYSYFAQYGPPEDKDRWNSIAWKSRRYQLPRATGIDPSGIGAPNNYTGTNTNNQGNNTNTALPPFQTYLDGKAYDGWAFFGSDSWRVISNLAVDYMWWKSTDASQNYWDYEPQIASKLLTFFAGKNSSEAGGQYGAQYYLDGTREHYYDGQGNEYPVRHTETTGLIGMNGVGAAIVSGTTGVPFVQDLWNSEYVINNDNHYYNGSLYLLGIVEASGNFRPYAPGSVVSPTGKPPAHSGTWMTQLKTDSGSTWSNQFQYVNVTPNTDYTLGCYLYGTGKVVVRVDKGTWGGEITRQTFSNGSDSWNPTSFIFNSGK